jgi:hypothetical protein
VWQKHLTQPAFQLDDAMLAAFRAPWQTGAAWNWLSD